jgi:hypothetical protein
MHPQPRPKFVLKPRKPKRATAEFAPKGINWAEVAMWRADDQALGETGLREFGKLMRGMVYPCAYDLFNQTSRGPGQMAAGTPGDFD